MVEEMQEKQKTIVAFVVGLLIGGLLVWMFSGGDSTSVVTNDVTDVVLTEEESMDAEKEIENTETSAPALQVGEGDISVSDQSAGTRIALNNAVYPVSEGWVGVRDYDNGQLGGILGVVRFSESQGLVPENIVLQRPTLAGNSYAVVVFTENGDRSFNLADDVQIDTIFSTFTAQ